MRIDYNDYILNVPDFPLPGIIYKDIQPLLANEIALNMAITDMGSMIKTVPDYWVGIESRGFLFASALSLRWGGGVRLIRKKGKLPPVDLVTEQYELEYGVDIIQMKKGSGSVVIVDDILATGGTMRAAEKIVSAAGYQLLDKIVLLDIGLIESNTKSVINNV
jgi:adenine phosphoribosyltransferase|tara:strand:- start:610 stop:1098 length:489 start_codon:yes stop_codon:yes gene_type:complete